MRPQIMLREYGKGDCRCKETPLIRKGQEESGSGGPLLGEAASKARRGMAVAQDGPYLSVVARVLSGRTACPTSGTKETLKKTTSYSLPTPGTSGVP